MKKVKGYLLYDWSENFKSTSMARLQVLVARFRHTCFWGCTLLYNFGVMPSCHFAVFGATGTSHPKLVNSSPNSQIIH